MKKGKYFFAFLLKGNNLFTVFTSSIILFFNILTNFFVKFTFSIELRNLLNSHIDMARFQKTSYRLFTIDLKLIV